MKADDASDGQSNWNFTQEFVSVLIAVRRCSNVEQMCVRNHSTTEPFDSPVGFDCVNGRSVVLADG
jgi:hypothetical protein